MQFPEWLNENTNMSCFSNATNGSNTCFHYRSMKDPIYNFIKFDKTIWRIVDTPHFQRLREIKQLGITHLVFPSANHTRFEHCLGTGWLADKFFNKIVRESHNSQYQSIGFENQTDYMRKNILVCIAGLCHDIGHGPFSHMFDNHLLPRLGVKDWKHEMGSNMLIDDMFEKYDILSKFDLEYDFGREDINLIKQLIDGKSPTQLGGASDWIFEIISNKKNSIDVDKFDYVQRDSYTLGLQNHQFDYESLMNNCRVIDNTLAYAVNQTFSVYDLFNTRYRLFRNIYLHRVSIGIEAMLCDALVLANHKFHLEETINNPDLYLSLTDSILKEIERKGAKNKLREANQILDRIKCRDLYKFVSELILDSKQFKQIGSLENIKKFMVQENPTLNENDIIVAVNNINYCMKDKNPVDFVDFWQQNNPSKKFNKKWNEVSLLLPQQFSEYLIRIYVKHKQDMEKVKAGFKNYIKYLNKDIFNNQNLFQDNYEKCSQELSFSKKSSNFFKSSTDKFGRDFNPRAKSQHPSSQSQDEMEVQDSQFKKVKLNTEETLYKIKSDNHNLP